MQKIIIIGCPGSGKSVFARRLGETTGIPVVHLDNLYWNADRTTVPREVFRARLTRAMAGERWIIDGNYASTMALRLEACDTAFFLDYPTEVCLEGIRARRGRARDDMPWVEEGEDEEFLRFVRRFQTDTRPEVLALLEQYPGREIHTFKARDEAEDWLKTRFGSTLEFD